MSWIETSFEKEMKLYFIEELENIKGEELFVRYSSLRDFLIRDNFFDEIKGAEPDLTDHSSKHIQDVQERAFKLIGKDKFRELNVFEVYSLALMILLHDVGNIHERSNHESKERIAQVYNHYRPNSIYRAERRIVLAGASAHSGTTDDGSRDTLKKLVDDDLNGEPIRVKELAALLRFADELSEGMHRTNSYSIKYSLFKNSSKIFHSYALCTSIGIDRHLERVSITYDIEIEKPFNKKAQTNLKNLLLFTFYRAIKLDIERRYTKSHSEILKIFRLISVQYNFTYDGVPIAFELPRLEFEDRYPIPGEENELNTTSSYEDYFLKKDNKYKIDDVIATLKVKLK